jgi:hypothetical protein
MITGFDLPYDTQVTWSSNLHWRTGKYVVTGQIANLWNAGDGVKEYANGGTTACAETAQLVAQQGGGALSGRRRGLTPRRGLTVRWPPAHPRTSVALRRG